MSAVLMIPVDLSLSDLLVGDLLELVLFSASAAVGALVVVAFLAHRAWSQRLTALRAGSYSLGIDHDVVAAERTILRNEVFLIEAAIGRRNVNGGIRANAGCIRVSTTVPLESRISNFQPSAEPLTAVF